MKPRIAIPIPTSFDPEYNERTWPQYARAVELSGGEPVAIPLADPPAVTAKLIESCTGVVLPGSGADVNPQKYGQDVDPAAAPADPARENVDELLLQDAHNMGKPILGICFGTQMLNVWRGGSLVQDLRETPVKHKAGKDVVEAHAVEIAPESGLGRLLGAASSLNGKGLRLEAVNSSHHQAIAAPGDGLQVVARCAEDGVIEAVEGGFPGSPDAERNLILGVQWHPERTYEQSELSRSLFGWLVTQAAAWVPRPVTTSVG